MPSDAPLADAVDAFLADPGTTFTVPGHKRAPGIADPLLMLDLPLVSGADDSRLGGDVLGKAARLAAQLWGADLCRFSVAGSTHGNQSLALAAARPGDRVAVARTLHKSMFGGLMLSDLEAIAAVVHGAAVPLIVDQAWGAHLGFHPALPAHAIDRGADAMVTSTHKTLTAFTQGSVVLARGGLLDLSRVEESFELLHTTSPSAAILASTDRARQLIEDRGRQLLEQAIALVADARARLGRIDGLHVSEASDPVKLVLGLA